MRIQSWSYLDTVEVIGSIPVAPIGSNLFRFISFPSLLLIHPIACKRLQLFGFSRATENLRKPDPSPSAAPVGKSMV